MATSNIPIDSLQKGPLSSRPVWYGCFEGFVSKDSAHLIYYDSVSKLPNQLIPLYLFKESPFFTHDPGFLLMGGLLGNTTIEQKITKSLLPNAVSVQPFSYRYDISHSDKDADQLTSEHISDLENRALKNKSKIIAFLFIDHTQNGFKEVLANNDYTSLPIAVRKIQIKSSNHQSLVLSPK